MRNRRPIFLLTAALALTFSLAGCNQGKSIVPTVPAHELDSPALLGATTGSQNYIHVFASRGIYPYHCTYHTTAHHRMAGTVMVEDSGQDSAFISIFQGAFTPATATVKPNGQVRWQ